MFKKWLNYALGIALLLIIVATYNVSAIKSVLADGIELSQNVVSDVNVEPYTTDGYVFKLNQANFNAYSKFDLKYSITLNSNNVGSHSPKNGDKLIYNFSPYLKSLATSPIPFGVQLNSGFKQGGVAEVKDGKLILTFNGSELYGWPYSFKLPVTFSDEIQSVYDNPTNANLSVPLTFPGFYIHDYTNNRYPVNSNFSDSLSDIPHYSVDDDISSTDAWVISMNKQNYSHVDMRGTVTNKINGDPSNFVVVDKGFYFNPKIFVETSSFVPNEGTSLVYDLPPYVVYKGDESVPIYGDDNGVQYLAGSLSVKNNKLVYTFNKNAVGKYGFFATSAPLKFGFTSDVKKLLRKSDVENVNIPFSFPNAQVNTFPNGASTSTDFKLPSFTLNKTPLANPDCLALHVGLAPQFPKEKYGLIIKVTHVNTDSKVSNVYPLTENENFGLSFNFNEVWGSDWKYIPEDGGSATYQLPSYIVNNGSESIPLVDTVNNEVVGSASIANSKLTVTFNKKPQPNAQIYTQSSFILGVDKKIMTPLQNPLTEQVNVPLAIPYSNINNVPLEENRYLGYVGDPAPTVEPTIDHQPLSDSSVFSLPFVKVSPYADNEDTPNGDFTPSSSEGRVNQDPLDDPNALPASDLDLKISLSYKDKPLSEADPYTENDNLDLKATFKSLPGISYKDKRIYYRLPANYTTFANALTDAKIVDSKTGVEVGTLTINQSKLIFNFTTDIQFEGEFTTKLGFNIFEAGKNAKPGEPINVAFTVPGAILEGKQQPVEVDTFPAPTLGNVQPVLPDKNMIILHPRRVTHLEKPTPYDGKTNSSYYSDESNPWQLGASHLYPGNVNQNTFFIGYELPWRGQAVKFDKSSLHIGTTKLPAINYDGLAEDIYDPVLKDYIFKDSNYFFNNKDMVMYVRRVWFHTGKNGEPLVTQKRVPILDSKGVLRDDLLTSKPVTVPLNAVETSYFDLKPPEGFTEKDPCGLVIRIANYHQTDLRISLKTQINDLSAAQEVNKNGDLVFKNNWYYGQEVYDKENPNANAFFDSLEPVYTGTLVRTVASVQGRVIYGGKVKVLKVDSHDNKIKLKGAHFALVNASGEPIFDENRRLLNRLVTNDQGELCYEDPNTSTLTPLDQISLPQMSGVVLIENQAPDGYIMPDSPKTSLKPITGSLQTIVIKNEKKELPPQTNIDIQHNGLYYRLTLLSGLLGAIFTIAFIWKRRYNIK